MSEIEMKAKIYDLLVTIEQAKAEITKLQEELAKKPVAETPQS